MQIEIPELGSDSFEVFEWKHAHAILRTDFPDEFQDIVSVLNSFKVKKSHIVQSGGGKSKLAQEIDLSFKKLGWVEKKFLTGVTVDGITRESPTHKVDCFKNRIALELEWSNKDPFFDRDLNNFRLLFDLRAVSVGIIITKSDSFRQVFEDLGIWSKYGTSTTWISKLLPRIEGGGGGGCPILVLGITSNLYAENE